MIAKINKTILNKIKNVAVSFRKIGKNIKRYREKRGMSQEVLAHKAGLTLSNLAKLEGGFSQNPTIGSLYPLAKILTGGSIDKLL